MQIRIVPVLCCFLFLIALVPPIAAGEFSIRTSIDNSPATWGDTIDFWGTADTAMSSDTDGVYILLLDKDHEVTIPKPKKGCDSLRFDLEAPIITPSGGQWSFSWNTGTAACNYPTEDMTVYIEAYQVTGGQVDAGLTKRFTIDMQAVTTPIPTPTENLSAKVAALETQVAEQKSTVAALSTVAARKTVNYTARMEAIEKNASEQRAKIAEQEDLIQQILNFLGLA